MLLIFMKNSFKLVRPKYRPDYMVYTKLIHSKMTRIWRLAIAAYIEAVANVVATHVDTGMSLASLFPLARDVKAGKMPIQTGNGPRKTLLTIEDGRPRKGMYKSITAGRAAGEKSGRISYGTKERPIFTFTFEIRVYQYLMNEIGAWNDFTLNSMVAGRQAMQEFLSINAPNIFPRVNEFFTKLQEK